MDPTSSKHPKIIYSTHPDVSLPRHINTLPALFFQTAAQQPNHPFLTFENDATGVTETLTYGETLTRVQQLASVLHRYQARSPTSSAPRSSTFSGRRPIGIWLEKSIDLHLAILATTFSGSPWLPFDPDAPAERVGVCLEDSGASIIICDADHEERARTATMGREAEVMTFAQLSRIAEMSDGEIDEDILPRGENTAYMIYTSGSTGTPKGIEISHKAAVTFAWSERSILCTGPNDVVWQGFSPAFDMFIEEVWVTRDACRECD